LEDPDAPEVKDFVAKQVELADEVLAGCGTRAKLQKKVTALYNYPRYGCPTKRGHHRFYHHNTGLQSQSVLYMQVIFSP
jgi:prolyl oligopeptidase